MSMRRNSVFRPGFHAGTPRGWHADYNLVALRGTLRLGAIICGLALVLLLAGQIAASVGSAHAAKGSRHASSATASMVDTVSPTKPTPVPPLLPQPDIREPVSSTGFTYTTPGSAPSSTATSPTPAPRGKHGPPNLPPLPGLPPISPGNSNPTTGICAIIQCN